MPRVYGKMEGSMKRGEKETWQGLCIGFWWSTIGSIPLLWGGLLISGSRDLSGFRY